MVELANERHHARLAPSAAHRWAKCPGSAVLEARRPEGKSSDAADHGTAAHELAAQCLRMEVPASHFKDRVIDINGKDVATMFLKEGSPIGPGCYTVDAEMVESIQGFIDLIAEHTKGEGKTLLVETRVHPRVHDDCHGTADVIVFDGVTTILHVFDLKYGRGVVVETGTSDRLNEQIGLYASGGRAGTNQSVGAIRGHNYQPRAPHSKGPHRCVDINTKELDTFETKMRIAAENVDRAESGYGDDTPYFWQGEYLSAGEHCRFCAESATCPTRADEALKLAQTEFGAVDELKPPAEMSSEELAAVLTKARQIQHWIKSVEEYASAEAKAGRIPTGFKQVSASVKRVWRDEDKLKAFIPVFISVGVDELTEPPPPAKLLSPAKLEKLIPPKERPSLAPFVKKQAGNTILVPLDDPRPAMVPDAKDEFG